MKARISYIISMVVVFVVGFNLTGYSQEKGYPNKPVQLIVASRAGGGIDLFFRMLSEELKKQWKVSMPIENQTGAMGVTAANAVAVAKKDGYTFCGIQLGILSSMAAAKPDSPINLLRDFDPVLVNIDYASMVLAVRSDSPFKTVKDIVTYAKEKPGELVCGTTQRGSEIFLNWELLKRSTKIDAATLAFTGSAEAIPQILGGHIQLCITSDVTAKPYIDAGRMRGIATDTRSLLFPELPTFIESGYPDVNLFGCFTLLAPKGVSPAILKTWTSALEIVLKDPEFVASTKKLGFKTNYQLDAKKNEDFFKGEIKKYSRFSPEDLGWK